MDFKFNYIFTVTCILLTLANSIQATSFSPADNFILPKYIHQHTAIKTSSGRSEIECMTFCKRHSYCLLVIHSPSDKQCQSLIGQIGSTVNLANASFVNDGNQQLWVSDSCWQEVRLLAYNFSTSISLASKPTKQISTFEVGSSDKAIDGNYNGNWYHGSCTHTTIAGSDNWWVVDITFPRFIANVRVFHRTDDNCHTWFNNISIQVSNLLEAWNSPSLSLYSQCAHYAGPPSANSTKVDFECSHPLAEGRYIMVYKKVPSFNALVLCEVEISGI